MVSATASLLCVGVRSDELRGAFPRHLALCTRFNQSATQMTHARGPVARRSLSRVVSFVSLQIVLLNPLELAHGVDVLRVQDPRQRGGQKHITMQKSLCLTGESGAVGSPRCL